MGTFYLFLFMVIAYTCSTVNGNVYFHATKPTNEWWSNTITYQVYPRSFKDSNNDGIGDLKGIIQKLDHFVDLGIETLWIGPFFKSPMDDMGYDVENFYEIDPIFGTLADFDELVLEMKKRNLKLVTDFIPNHSSYKCEWFKKSIKREDKYADYYIWRNASNQDDILKNSTIEPTPPNNWLSVFGGSGWTWNDERQQFYYHQFNSKQPDFKIRNPEIHKEIFAIIKFWMDRGIVGFRFDALRHLYESDSFLDEPCLTTEAECKVNHDSLNHTYTVDQPENIEIIREWREFVDNYTKNNDRPISSFIATESYSPIKVLMQYYGNSTKAGAHLPFNFGLLTVDKRNIIESIDTNIKKWLDNMPENQVANWVVENHDNPRMPTKFSPEMVPLFTALKLSLPGIEVTYYGSEIGMDNTYVRPDQSQDPNNAGGNRLEESRDNERCPMQWDSSINAGFTEAKKPWLPINPNYYKVNVESQKKIPTSNYNFYKKMSLLRKTDTLKNGDLQTYNITKSIYILKRSLLERESYVVVMNFGSETETVILSNYVKNLNEELFVYLGSENSEYITGNIVSTVSSTLYPLTLRPQSVIVLTDKHIELEKIDTQNAGTRISSTLISLLGAFLLLRNFF
ncbi:maltase 2 [Acyrthosiphon pisum]|uniref:alpha-glucosidase n=1 Tax=Acyrthosiphon pisum TaxID=7029 RepID=A0A8R1W976_ACYPI|nr:maltase 2 [Acyrthosiphon pisum]|eukprot:XP_003246887.1 PREDICTED: maltase 2 [Acyrthosiphon pisum]